jgi:hypothetical protein
VPQRPPTSSLSPESLLLPPSAPAPGWRWHNELYLGFWFFLERLLNDSSIRTDDPYEANLFYVPALAYYYSGNIGDAGEHIKQVVRCAAGAASCLPGGHHSGVDEGCRGPRAGAGCAAPLPSASTPSPLLRAGT